MLKITYIYTKGNKVLNDIDNFLSQNMSPEYTTSRMTSIRLIESQGLLSPTTTLMEAVSQQDTIPPIDIVTFIDEVLDNFLTDILAQFFIILRGDVEYKTKFLQALNLLDDYIDSDVIVENYDSDVQPDEALVKLMALVGEEEIEYYDEFLVDVRPQLLNRLIAKHTAQADLTIQNEEHSSHIQRITLVKNFKGTHGDTIITDAIIDGTVKLGLSGNILLAMFRTDIYKLSDPNEIAKTIYALALVSDVELESVNTFALDLITELYTDMETVTAVTSSISEYTIRR